MIIDININPRLKKNMTILRNILTLTLVLNNYINCH